MIPPPRPPSIRTREVSISSGTDASKQADRKVEVTGVSPPRHRGRSDNRNLPEKPSAKATAHKAHKKHHTESTSVKRSSEKQKRNKPKPILKKREPCNRRGAPAILSSWETPPQQQPKSKKRRKGPPPSSSDSSYGWNDFGKPSEGNIDPNAADGQILRPTPS